MSLRPPFGDSRTRDEALSAYLDGELSADERLELEQALLDHPEDLRTLEAFKAVGRALRELLPEGEVPTGWMLRACRIGARTPARRGSHAFAVEALMRRSAQGLAMGHGAGLGRRATGRRILKVRRRP